MESVLEVADEYQEVSDLLMRHATLLATNTDLKEHQHKCRCACMWGRAGGSGLDGWLAGMPSWYHPGLPPAIFCTRAGASCPPPAQPFQHTSPTNHLMCNCSELAESIRAELAVYVKQKTDEILSLNNVLARLKKQLETCEGDALVQVGWV